MNLINVEIRSDSGPWRRYTCTCGCANEHVVPGFEHRKHALILECWCHPWLELVEDGVIVHHNVAQ